MYCYSRQIKEKRTHQAITDRTGSPGPHKPWVDSPTQGIPALAAAQNRDSTLTLSYVNWILRGLQV